MMQTGAADTYGNAFNPCFTDQSLRTNGLIVTLPPQRSATYTSGELQESDVAWSAPLNGWFAGYLGEDGTQYGLIVNGTQNNITGGLVAMQSLVTQINGTSASTNYSPESLVRDTGNAMTMLTSAASFVTPTLQATISAMKRTGNQTAAQIAGLLQNAQSEIVSAKQAGAQALAAAQQAQGGGAYRTSRKNKRKNKRHNKRRHSRSRKNK
jgi:hypothetical protein